MKAIDRGAFVLKALVACACTLLSCTRDESHPTSPLAAPSLENLSGGGDPEVFGKVFENGRATTRTDLIVTINPLDLETQSHLRGRFDAGMWVNPTGSGYPKNRMWGWFDPKAGDNCGGLGPYVLGDSTARAMEVHRHSASQPPDPNAREAHCIRPGRYQFTLSGSGVSRTYQFEYVAIRQLKATDASSGQLLLVEPTSYDTANVWNDYTLNVDLTTSGSFATPVIRMQNSHGNPDGGTFADEATVSANETDWLRFSSLGSTGVSWTLDPLGQAIARYHWDLGAQGAPPPYFVDDRNVEPLIRVHRFDDIPVTRPVVVALQLMQPNNDPGQLPAPTTRIIDFTRLGPVACATFEGTTTWIYTDQVPNAGCSTLGTNIQYRWQFDASGSWTPYQSDPRYNYFQGHGTAGPHVVTLEAKNTSNGVSTTQSYGFSAAANQVAISGRTFVTDKATNWYYARDPSARLVGWWFERFDTDTQWWPAEASAQDSMGRIWYSGNYTVDIRQQDSSASLLRRGRLHITVCNPRGGGGGLLLADTATTAAPVAGWALFGGGPWISWGSGNSLRFYDLLGTHDVANRSTDATWLTDVGGQATATGAGSYLSWRKRNLQNADALAFDFTLAAASSPFSFGLALDPDLGANAADDMSGYDPQRGMAYVWDGFQAVGYLLRDQVGADALRGVTQYGRSRQPPRSHSQISAALRRTGVDLLPGRSDVQLLPTAPAQPGAATWTFVMVRSTSVAELRARADIVLAGLATGQGLQ